MRGAVLGFGLALLLVSVLAGGLAPLGRVALSLGLPSLAASLLADPEWRGVALYRAGRFEEAGEAFAAAGPQAAFNRGNARVQTRAYAAALESYDVAMARRDDPAAQANFDLVAAFYAGTRLGADSIALWGRKREGATMAAPIARGSARASSTGDAVTNTGATIGLPFLQSTEQRQVRKVFDDKFVVADDRWLVTLEDVPGAFLKARIAHEHKRRRKAGTGQIPEDTEW